MDVPLRTFYGRVVGTPSDPQQPQQPPWPSTGEQPAYPAHLYGSQQPPSGYPHYSGYPQHGSRVWPPVGPLRRPVTLIAAGVIWLLLAVLTLLFGISALLADRIPDIDQVYEENPSLTPELVRDFGIAATTAGLVLVVLGIAVFSGALWARAASMVIGGVVGLFGFVLVVPLVLAIAAIVLQFLPASNAYAQARRERT